MCRLLDLYDGQQPILKCLERIESELNATVVASNPMFWYVLSKLGMKYPVTGYGRLLREWPRCEIERGSTGQAGGFQEGTLFSSGFLLTSPQDAAKILALNAKNSSG